MNDNMKKVSLANGFEAEIDTGKLDDAEIIVLLGKAEKNKNLASFYMSEVLDKLMGADKLEELMDTLRTADNRVPQEDFAKATLEIFEAIGKKN